MDALEVAEDITLPDTRVALCGDWHGNIGWVRTLAKAIPHLAPDIRTIMQLGDWSMDPASDALLIEAGIERVYVTLGNHEIYSDITPLLNAHPRTRCPCLRDHLDPPPAGTADYRRTFRALPGRRHLRRQGLEA